MFYLESEFSKTIETIKKHVSTSKVLPKCLKTNCNEVLCYIKKVREGLFFNSLEYNTIISKVGQETINTSRKLRVPQMKKAFQKLSCQDLRNEQKNQDRDKDSSINVDSWMRGQQNLNDEKGIDNSFNNDVAKQSFQKSLRFGSVLSAETSLYTLILSDAIISDKVDSIRVMLDKLEVINSQ